MGWIANYRWLSSLEHQQLPSIDRAKRAATKAELKVAKHLRKHPGVLKVHHAVRLTKIKGGKSRREVDLIAIMADRILLIEVKNYRGAITMDEKGVLHQNGQSRGWSFSKLDDAIKRLKDTMGLTGIALGATEVHSVLMFQGSGQVEESVDTGQRLLGAHVARSLTELASIVEIPLGEDALMSKPLLKATQTFFNRCGTWDSVVANNGAEMDGDLRSSAPVNEWRKAYQNLNFKNLRGWWRTFFFGPQYGAEATGWSGEIEHLDIDVSQTVDLIEAGSKRVNIRVDHLASVSFGYQELPDWSAMVLMEPPPPPAESVQFNTQASKKSGRGQPPYKKGDVIGSATVSGFHDDLGIFFTLDKENSALYRKENMEELEWSMRETFYRVGTDMDVKVIKVKQKGKSGWNIEVLSAD